MEKMNREQFIINSVQEHYDECVSLGYEIFGVFLQGSQNYGLDVYSDSYRSDIDTKAIVLPSLDDCIMNRANISTVHVRENNEHIDIKDIYTMFQIFKKQNINGIEILFTPYKIINPKYADLAAQLIGAREEIAHAHLNQALRCMAGMSMEKVKALCHPYPSLVDKIERYGYDPKQLHHIFRLNYFIRDYVAGKSYAECLYPSEEVRNLLIKIKTEPMELEAAKRVADIIDKETNDIKNKYIEPVENVKVENYQILDEVKKKALKRHFEEELKREENQ